MASTDPGPSNAEVKVKVDKLAQQAAKAEARRVESRKLLAEYHDMLKKVQGSPSFVRISAQVLLGSDRESQNETKHTHCYTGRTIDLNENKEFQRILQRANELLAQGCFGSCLCIMQSPQALATVLSAFHHGIDRAHAAAG